MKEYKAYNRLYHNGKPVGKVYVNATGCGEAEARRKSQKSNADWNRRSKDKSYHAKTVAVTSGVYYKQKKRSSGGSLLGFKVWP